MTFSLKRVTNFKIHVSQTVPFRRKEDAKVAFSIFPGFSSFFFQSKTGTKYLQRLLHNKCQFCASADRQMSKLHFQKKWKSEIHLMRFNLQNWFNQTSLQNLNRDYLSVCPFSLRCILIRNE
jgi:hypothetical protein